MGKLSRVLGKDSKTRPPPRESSFSLSDSSDRREGGQNGRSKCSVALRRRRAGPRLWGLPRKPTRSHVCLWGWNSITALTCPRALLNNNLPPRARAQDGRSPEGLHGEGRRKKERNSQNGETETQLPKVLIEGSHNYELCLCHGLTFSTSCCHS